VPTIYNGCWIEVVGRFALPTLRSCRAYWFASWSGSGAPRRLSRRASRVCWQQL